MCARRFEQVPRHGFEWLPNAPADWNRAVGSIGFSNALLEQKALARGAACRINLTYRKI